MNNYLKYLGKDYHSFGKLACVKFYQWVYNDLHRPKIKLTGDFTKWDRALSMVGELNKIATPIKLEDTISGDATLLIYGKASYHLGYLIKGDEDYVLHVVKDQTSGIDKLRCVVNSVNKVRLGGFYRYGRL